MKWAAPVAVVVAALLVLGALVLVGRSEGHRHAREENRGIAEIRALVGPLDQRSLDRYRLLPEFSCLLYGRNGNAFALELCIDADGRVVEAIDRRNRRKPRISSLREDPSAATVRVDRAEVDRLIKKLEESP
jgi:hypothetical protein